MRWRQDIPGVGPAKGQAHRHLLSFRDHVLNRILQIRVGAADLGGPLLVVLPAANGGPGGIVVDKRQWQLARR